MPTLRLRAILAAALLLSVCNIVLAQSKSPPTMAEDQRILPFTRPSP